MVNPYWDYRDTKENYRRMSRSEWPPLIITVAITGGVQGKEANPNLPETPEEQAQATYEAYQAGASIVHVHARDKGVGYADTSGKPEDFRYVNALIRDKCPDIIVNNTTGGSFGMTMEERVKILDAFPEMATLNMGPNSVRFTLKKRIPPLSGRPADVTFEGLDLVTPSAWSETETFARIMLDREIKPEMELYNSGQYWLVDNLIQKNLLKQPYFVQFVMGVQSGTWPSPKNLIWLSEMAPQPCVINVAGTSGSQLPLNTMAIILGFHARTGLEDNVYYKRGQLATSNGQLVERVVRLSRELNRDIASPAQARQMLNVSIHPRKW